MRPNATHQELCQSHSMITPAAFGFALSAPYTR